MWTLAAPYRGVPGVEAWALPAPELRVSISREAHAPSTEAVERRWAQLVAENPRYYNGGLLAVLGYDEADHAILTRVDTYQRLAVQPQVMTGVRLLAVTAVLIARGDAGTPFTLLGRRGVGTRVFGGMWELGPSGGVSPPPPAVRELSAADLMRHLSDEITEEVGLDVRTGRPAAIVRDLIAFSDDVAIVCEIGDLGAAQAAAGPANWEYSETTWVALDEIADWDRQHSTETIAATRALFRVLGWVPAEV